MSSLILKMRTAWRLGPLGTWRVLDERMRLRRERVAVSAGGSHWPSNRAVHRAMSFSVAYDALSAEAGTRLPFFVDGAPEAGDDSAAVRALIARADLFCDHVFEFLGSGPIPLGEKIEWSLDFKSGYRWGPRYMSDLCLVDLSNNADVKVPWELARHQHFVTLGQAYVLTGDEKYAREFVAQFTSWMDEAPPMLGVTWACTMDVALRAISWTWAWHLFARSPSFDEAARRRFLAGILAHGRFIMTHLEWGEIRGNHYLSNGAGLAVIGLAFQDFRESATWRNKGFEIVWGELPLQVLPDGVGFEMSTSYQRLVAELVITPTLLARLNSLAVPESVWSGIEKMLEFVMAATRPDGEIVLFGDSDDGRVQILSEETRLRINDHRYLLALGAALFGRADMKAASGGWHPELDWLLSAEYRARFDDLEAVPDTSPKAFHEGGFYVMRDENRLWAMVDCGPVGLGGTGGHGHNDALSFDLSVQGVPVVVDSGTYVYSADPDARNEFRGTKAHNVLVVDDAEMADLGEDLWTIENQACAECVSWSVGPGGQELVARHHGYERLSEPVTVERRFACGGAAEGFVVEDRIEGVGRHDLELRFHTALDVTHEGQGFVLVGENGPVCSVCCSVAGNPFVESAWLSPSYGVRRNGTVFGWRFRKAGVPWTACTVFRSEKAGDSL